MSDESMLRRIFRFGKDALERREREAGILRNAFHVEGLAVYGHAVGFADVGVGHRVHLEVPTERSDVYAGRKRKGFREARVRFPRGYESRLAVSSVDSCRLARYRAGLRHFPKTHTTCNGLRPARTIQASCFRGRTPNRR